MVTARITLTQRQMFRQSIESRAQNSNQTLSVYKFTLNSVQSIFANFQEIRLNLNPPSFHLRYQYLLFLPRVRSNNRCAILNSS